MENAVFTIFLFDYSHVLLFRRTVLRLVLANFLVRVFNRYDFIVTFFRVVFVHLGYPVLVLAKVANITVI